MEERWGGEQAEWGGVAFTDALPLSHLVPSLLILYLLALPPFYVLIVYSRKIRYYDGLLTSMLGFPMYFVFNESQWMNSA